MTLAQFLYPGLQAIDHDGNLAPITRGLRPFGKLTVLPRELFEVSRATIPRGDSKGIRSAREKAKFETDFADPQIMIDVQRKGRHPTLATIWCWDRSMLPNAARALPEPLARIPLIDGARIVQGLSGYEGEVWSDGYCIASRWWSSEPSSPEWDAFQTGARSRYWPQDTNGSALVYPKPEVEQPEWVNNKIWVSKDWYDRLTSIRPLQIALVSAVMLAAPYTYTLSEIAILNRDNALLERRLDDERAAAAPWLADQRRAFSELGQIRQLTSIGDSEAILFALVDLESELGTHRLHATQISFDAPRLQVRLESNSGSTTDTVTLIEELESSKNLTGVRYDSSTNSILGTVVADLDGGGVSP